MSQSRFLRWFQQGLTPDPEDATLLDVCWGLFRRLFWFLLTGGCVAALIACCVSWNASHAQFSTLWNGLREACCESFGSSKRSIVRRSPHDQANFWLAETERVLPQTSRTSEQLMGAALILDAPLQDYQNDQIRRLYREGRTEPIDELLQQFVLPFEQSCSAKSLELVAESVRISPDNKELWRLRAMLLFYPQYSWDENSVRDPDWQAVLKTAAAHDPDNALYDYLTAFILKSQSAEVRYGEWPASGDSVDVKQPELYQTALTHFEYGQAKAYLRFPLQNGQRALQFANQSSMSAHAAARVAMSASGHTFGYRGMALVRGMQRWIGVRSDDAYHDGDLEFAIQLALQANRLCDQSETEFAGETIRRATETYRDIHAVNIHRIRQDCPELLASVTYPDIATRAAEGQLRSKVLIRISKGVFEQFGITNPYQLQSAGEVTSVCQLLLWGAGSLCLSLVAFAACYRIKPTSGVVTFGEFRHAITFGAAFAVSVLLAGGITKDVISESNLEIVIRVVGGIFFGVVCIFLLRRWHLRGKSQRVVRKRFLIPGVVVSACFFQAVLFPLIEYSISADSAQFGSINAIPAATVWLEPSLTLPACIGIYTSLEIV